MSAVEGHELFAGKNGCYFSGVGNTLPPFSSQYLRLGLYSHLWQLHTLTDLIPPQLTFCFLRSALFGSPDINNAAAAVANIKPDVFFEVDLKFLKFLIRRFNYLAVESRTKHSRSADKQLVIIKQYSLQSVANL
ncbi:MAG: hypothetical protein Q7U43_15665 [Methylococcaceae bacterium]|nr:hypothetical protein [Methylococcaceae bacterium]MDP2392510.1 hypothetical protein [Methylococcaceae bacterium]